MAENKKNKAMKFFRETKAELKKVSWPSKSQLINNTGVILTFIVIATVVLFLLDIGFEKLLSFVVR